MNDAGICQNCVDRGISSPLPAIDRGLQTHSPDQKGKQKIRPDIPTRVIRNAPVFAAKEDSKKKTDKQKDKEREHFNQPYISDEVKMFSDPFEDNDNKDTAEIEGTWMDLAGDG